VRIDARGEVEGLRVTGAGSMRVLVNGEQQAS
jgi:hypothetical protein